MSNPVGIASGAQGALQPATQNAANSDMDRMAFLKLFTTQLQNQDPLDPVKNEAFVAQLAQFSQLEATTRMASSMEAMAASVQGERLMSGAALIGRKVASPEGTAQLMETGSISGIVSLPEGASSVRLDVYDAGGKNVFRQSLGRQPPGDLTLRWDGVDTTGARLPPGRYTITATVDSFGSITKLPITTPAAVRSVSWSDAASDLLLELEDGATVPLSKVRRVDG